MKIIYEEHYYYYGSSTLRAPSTLACVETVRCAPARTPFAQLPDRWRSVRSVRSIFIVIILLLLYIKETFYLAPDAILQKQKKLPTEENTFYLSLSLLSLALPLPDRDKSLDHDFGKSSWPMIWARVRGSAPCD